MATAEAILELQKSASIIRVVSIAFLALLPDFEAFFGYAFAIPAIVYYSDPTVTVIHEPLSSDQVSWFASTMSLFILLSSLFGSSLIDWLGRKTSLLIATLIAILAWGTLQISQEFPMLILNRMMTGVAVGIVMPCTLTYFSDIAPVMLRGPLGGLSISIKNFACTFCLILVAVLDFQLAIVIMSCPALFFLLCYPWIPESPQWLVTRNRMEEAEKALHAIRGSHYDVKTELLEMKQIHEEEVKKSLITGQSVGLMSAQFVRPCAIFVVLGILPMLAGPGLLFIYSLEMVENINLPFSKILFAIGIQVSMDMGFFVSLFSASAMPRRPVYITSAIVLTLGMTAATFSLATPAFEENNWLFPSSLMLVMFFYGVGMCPVLFTLLGEVFLPQHKGRGTGIVYAVRHFVLFLLLKIYPSLKANFGLCAFYLGETTIAAFTVIFAFIFLPETHGLTLTQLSRLYKRAEDQMGLMENSKESSSYGNLD